MKKHLLLLPLLLFGSSRMYGQSIKFDQLVYLATLNNDAVASTLKQGNAFKQDYSQEINGQQIEYFKNIGQKPNSERIATGSFTKLYDGTVLRTVEYSSTDVQNIVDMIAQARKYDGLTQQFYGNDDKNNIYLYDNSFYMVSIYQSLDRKSGRVVIKQKESLGFE